MRIQVLGPVRAWREGNPVDLGPAGRRAVLGLLALACGKPLSRAELIDALWGENPPSSAVNILQTQVKHLRRALEPARPRYTPSDYLPAIGDGYALVVPAERLDLTRFRGLVDAAAARERERDPAGAAALLDEAVRLWRGAALADVPQLSEHPKVVALAGERRAALARYGAAMLDAGDAAHALPALEELATDQPLDEAAQARLIRAYHAAGQRARAFGRYHDVRRLLADELGVDPGPELATAHAALLRDDAAPPGRVRPLDPRPDRPVPQDAVPADPRHPGTAQPGTAQPGAAQPGAAQPGAAQPGAAQPGAGQPGTGQPDSARYSTSNYATGPTDDPGQPATGADDGVGGARVAVPAQLPPDTGGFAGRTAHLLHLDRLFAPRVDGTPPVSICAIQGPAGVGKTALAVHWAHRVADRFPDGQLYLNLRGFHPSGPPMRPEEAVRALLDALGVAHHQVPVSPPAQVGLYRSLLARRRVLVLLDNVRDAEQARPLLPGGSGCIALVTSRNQLGGLVASAGASPLTLDLPSADEARLMLAGRVDPDRMAAEPEAADEIIARCGRLPLAVAVVAARAAARPDFPLGALAAELREAQTDETGGHGTGGYGTGGPDALAPFAGGDAATDVRAVFSWSYHALSGPAAELFRLLSLHPGTDLGRAAAASLSAVPRQLAARLLGELARAHLIIERSPGRYAMHDLLRHYATELAHEVEGAAGCRAALHRVLDHYTHAGYAATALLYPDLDLDVDLESRDGTAPGVVVEPPPDRAGALTWFAAELPNLLAATRAQSDRHTAALARMLAEPLDRQGRWRELAIVQAAALAATDRAGDRAGRAHAHRGLARAHARTDQNEDARLHLRCALDLYVELSDDVGQARTHMGLSWVAGTLSLNAEALYHAEQALSLFGAAGHRAGQANALNTVGWFHGRLGHHQLSVACCERALELHRELDNRPGQADTWDSLGLAYHQLGRYRNAAECYLRALHLYRELDARYNEADTLGRLGDTHRAAGDPAVAREVWRRALNILHELRHPAAEAVRTRLATLDGTPARQRDGSHPTWRDDSPAPAGRARMP